MHEVYDFSKLTAAFSGKSAPAENGNSPGKPADTPAKKPDQKTPAPNTSNPEVKNPNSPSSVYIEQTPPQPSIEGEFPEYQPPPLDPDTEPQDETPEPETEDPVELPIDPAEKPTDPAEQPSDPAEQPTDPAEQPSDPGKQPTDPDTKPATEPNTEPAPTITREQSPPAAGSPAYQILVQFLEATTLEERLPLIAKAELTDQQLKNSCLAGPLAPVKHKRLATMVPTDSNGMTQYFYYVTFEDKEETRQRYQMVVQLVERTGVHPPHVHATAFIEHYEKKFLHYG